MKIAAAPISQCGQPERFLVTDGSGKRLVTLHAESPYTIASNLAEIKDSIGVLSGEQQLNCQCVMQIFVKYYGYNTLVTIYVVPSDYVKDAKKLVGHKSRVRASMLGILCWKASRRWPHSFSALQRRFNGSTLCKCISCHPYFAQIGSHSSDFVRCHFRSKKKILWASLASP